jgi:hypothetical protein
MTLDPRLMTLDPRPSTLDHYPNSYVPNDMFDTYKRRKGFSFHLAIFEIEVTGYFKKMQFKVKLFLHIFKICQISRACILNLDR